MLRQLRQEAGFLLIGWVLIPERFHLLIKPEPAESTSGIMRELKKRSAQEIISIVVRTGLTQRSLRSSAVSVLEFEGHRGRRGFRFVCEPRVCG